MGAEQHSWPHPLQARSPAPYYQMSLDTTQHPLGPGSPLLEDSMWYSFFFLFFQTVCVLSFNSRSLPLFQKKPTSNVFSYSYLATCASASQLSISCPHRTVSPCLLAPRGGWYAELSLHCIGGSPLCLKSWGTSPGDSLETAEGRELRGRGEDIPDFKSLSVHGAFWLPAVKGTRHVSSSSEFCSFLKTSDCKAAARSIMGAT